MNTLLWCVVGALTGGIAGALMHATGLVNRIETMAVGVFGAFVGGEFVASMMGDGGDTFQASSLALAFAGATVMLLLLAVMRKAVGPMRPHKKARRRD